MKCDELKSVLVYCRDIDESIDKDFALAHGYEELFEKKDVDEAIAELKQAIHDAEMAKDDAEAANTEYRIDIEKLKAENRRFRRALYKACANWAKEVVASANGGITKYGENDNALRYFLAIEKAWKKVEQLCRAKAEEYK